MQSFESYDSTRVVFGGGATCLREFTPLDGKVLLVCRGGSIRRSGVRDPVRAALAAP